MNTGERIRYWRIKNGYTMTELGEKIGVTYTAMYRYEHSCVKRIPQKRLNALSQALNVPVDYLICKSDDPYSPGTREPIVTEELAKTKETLLTYFNLLNPKGRELLLYLAHLISGDRKNLN